jgi:DNA helicase-2/ATP-dependent DNA helicase PcrA
VYADTPAGVEEERRLLYVGVTRARDRLHISWAAARSPGGRGGRGPSRFLSGVAGVDMATQSAPRSRRAGRKAVTTVCRVCQRPLTDPKERKLGRCIDCPSSYDEALFDSLREWRRARAAEEKVPAYCVFTDATLTALAELQPGDLSSLVRVPGIGKAKVDKYGEEILALCASESVHSGDQAEPLGKFF